MSEEVRSGEMCDQVCWLSEKERSGSSPLFDGSRSMHVFGPGAVLRGEPKNTSRFEDTGAEIGRLVAEKNAAYGDSFAKSGEIMRILYPFGIRTEDMDDALAVVRVVDKLFRIATRKDAFGESPWRDVAGYGILGAVKDTLGTSVPKQTVPKQTQQPCMREMMSKAFEKDLARLREDGDQT